MSLAQAMVQLPFFAGIGYGLLTAIIYWQGGHRKRAGRYLLYFLTLSLLWIISVPLMTRTGHLANFPGQLLVACSLLLGLTTSAYNDWLERWWLLLAGLTLAIVMLLGFAGATPSLGVSQFVVIPPAASRLVTFVLWAVVSSYIGIRTWLTYRNTRLPWHANRLLFWMLSLVLIIGGEALIWSGDLTAVQALPLAGHLWVTWTGHITRLTGAASLVYAISFYQIFDVRTRFWRLLALLIYATVSAVPAAAALYLIARAMGPIEDVYAAPVVVGILTLGFLLYPNLTRLLERATQRYFLGEGLQTSVVVRSYSRAISKTLDLSQLSSVIITTISELLDIQRGALLLITAADGRYKIDTIPAMGSIPRPAMEFAKDSLFLRNLRQQQQPLLQYEIDFNPTYQSIAETERAWLSETGMELYIPVSTGTDLAGIIALGPKSSGHPYRPAELELVQILANQTVVALHNARLYRTLDTQNKTVRRLNADLRQQNERLEIMDQVKSDFITIASHELRTPLTQVKGYADILAAMNEESTLTREQTREIIGHITRASNQLEQLISAMLDASQLDMEGIQLSFVETKMDTVIRLATEPLLQAIRERRLRLRVLGIEELPTIVADFRRLVQAFSNILGNAVKYTPDGGTITVRADVVPSSNGGMDYLEVAITDTGIGIAPKFHDLIFEKFFRIGDPQLHSTGSTKYKGAGPGLGLPIAKGVIEAHIGRIWVESDEEDEVRLPGSTFFILLPVNPPALADKAEAVNLPVLTSRRQPVTATP